MEQFKGRSFFIKDKKELERVKRMIEKSGLKSWLATFVDENKSKIYNWIYFSESSNAFILITNELDKQLNIKNYSISTLQRLLKNVR